MVLNGCDEASNMVRGKEMMGGCQWLLPRDQRRDYETAGGPALES